VDPFTKVEWMGLLEGFPHPSSENVPVKIPKTYSSSAESEKPGSTE
jgi:hypothetical protein